jgi:cytochrome b561
MSAHSEPTTATGMAERPLDVAMHTHTDVATRSQVTRLLHLALLLIVINQVIGSNFMHRSAPGQGPAFPNQEHYWVGTAGLAAILLFWGWTVLRNARETPLSRLLPWFSGQRLKELGADVWSVLREVSAMKPPSDTHDALASAFHGLGLIVVTIMAATGFGSHYVFDGTRAGHICMTIHKLFANLMWGYLILHAAIAVFHHFFGSPIFARMFWFKDRRPL